MEDRVLEQTRRPSARRGLGRGLEAILPARGVEPARRARPEEGPPDVVGVLGDALGWARDEGSSVAVAVFGLEGFRHVNSRYGYAVGDAVLHDLAARITQARRSEDTVARLRGDEFVVICRRAVGGGDRIVARLAEEIERPLCVGGVVHHLRATIGIVVSEPGGGGRAARELLDAADLAMHRAKDEGRPWVGDDRPAPAAGLRYRPVARLANRLVTGALLPAWSDGFPVERLAADIEGWWRTAELPTGFRVWLDLRDPAPAPTAHRSRVAAVTAAVADAVAGGVLPAGRLGVLVPAGQAAGPVRGASLAAVLRQLAAAGVALAVDAADLVPAALADLLAVPLAGLWLPDGLVPAGDVRAVVARAMAALGRELGLDVIASGAEDDDSAGALEAIGCTHATGALFGRPVSAERFAGLLWVSAGAHQVPRWNTSPTGRLGRPAEAEGVSVATGWPRSTAPT